MSFNLSTRLNNLYQVVQNIQTTALTNPMVANLNMASYSVNNATSVNAPASTPLTLSADPTQGIVVNTKMTIPNHPLSITNNTTNDSLQVGDSLGDTNIFRVDASGNVAVKANPATPLTTDFTVNGSASVSGSITADSITAVSVNAGNVINNITGGTGILKTGSSSNPTLSANLTAGGGITLTPAVGGALQISATATTPNLTQVLTTGNDAGGLSMANVGSLSATSISASNIVNSITAGSNITIGGTANNPTISAVIPPASAQPKLSRLGFSASSSSPVSGGTVGYQSLSLLSGAFYNDIVAGTSPDANGVWVLDFSPLCLLLTGSVNTGAVAIGLGNNIDAGIYYNSPPNQAQFGSLPTTNGLVPRTGSCPPLIVKVSDLVSTCPNMASALTRLYFNNQSSDALWVQTLPLAVNCYYYPNGVQ